MSYNAAAGSHKSEQFTNLVLIGGRECIPGMLRSQQNPDLWVHGGAIIEKTLCVSGNIGTDQYFIGNVIAEHIFVDVIEEKYIGEGVTIVGDMNFTCGNVTNMGVLTVQTISASESCGNTGNILSIGPNVRIFGDLEVGANLIVNQTSMFEGEVHVVGNSFFNGTVTTNHIDATSVCTPLLECVQNITGPDTITINPEGNITNIIGQLNAEEVEISGNLNVQNNLYVQDDAYFFGNVYGINFQSGVSSFSAGTTGFVPNTPTLGPVVLSGTLNETHGGTGQTTYATGDILYADGPNSLNVLPIGSFSQVLTVSGGVPSWQNAVTGVGTVTSVGLTAPASVFVSPVANSPVTSSGTMNLAFTNQAANTFFAGPTSGGPDVPTFRSLSVTDVSGVAVTSFSAGTTGFQPSSPSTGAIVLSGVLGVPNGGTGLSTGPLSGQVLIGNGSSYTLNTLTAGSGIGITNAAGSITVSNTGVTGVSAGSGISLSGSTGVVTITSTGTAGVTSFSAGTTGLLPNSPSTGAVVLSGVLSTDNGGTGLSTTATNGQVLIGNGSGYTLNTLTAGTGVSITNASGSITLNNTGVTGISAGSGISVNASTGVVTISSTSGGGSVTSVGLTAPTSVFNSPATNSPVTTAGTLDLTFISQSANSVFAGPSAGGPAVPTFRSLVVADLPSNIPNSNLLNSAITVNGSTGLSVSGSPVSLGGTLTLTNTGVTSIVAGTGISVNASTGTVTVTSLAAAPDIVLDANATPTAPATGDVKGVWYGLNTKANAYDSSTVTIGNDADTAGASAVAVGLSAVASTNSVAVGPFAMNMQRSVSSVGVGLRANYGQAYSTGLATQSGGVVSGSGTNFRADMVNGRIVFDTGAEFDIVGFNTPTSINVTPTSPFIGGLGNNFQIFYWTDECVAVGARALEVNRRRENTAVGSGSMSLNVYGVGNTSIGHDSAANSQGNDFVAVGADAMVGTYYNGPGTVSQSGTTLTGVGTLFTPDMIGGYIIFGSPDDGNAEWSTISEFNSSTSLILGVSQTIGSTANFSIFYPASSNTAVGRGSLAAIRTAGSSGFGYNSLVQSTNGQYSFGTAGTAGVPSTTVTGSLTEWDGDMVGSVIVFTSSISGPTTATIVAFNSSTSLTVSQSLTIAPGTTYTIWGQARNTGIGHYAGSTVSTGARNTFVGDYSGVGYSFPTSLSTGCGNTLIGCRANCQQDDYGTVAVGGFSSAYGNYATSIGYKATSQAASSISIGHNANTTTVDSIAIGTNASTDAVSSGGAGLAITVPTDTLAVGVTPGPVTDALYIMINGVRYQIALTAVP